MKPSSGHKRISPAKARNAALLNQLATPGLGSIIAGRWLEGAGQLLLAIVGCGLILIWFVQTMQAYYGQMFSENPTHQPMAFTSLVLGLVIFAVSWFWSLVTSIVLVRTAGREDVDALKLFSAGQVKLDEARIVSALTSLIHWRRTGDVIARTYEFKDFPAAMQFVNAVADLAEQVQHHPDIDVRWNKVTLAFTTHDAGGLTEKDFTLARRCDALYRPS